MCAFKPETVYRSSSAGIVALLNRTKKESDHLVILKSPVNDTTPLPPDRVAAAHAIFDSQGLMRELGATITALAGGHCVIELPFSDRVSQQSGLFHGGIIGAIADTAGGCAAFTLFPTGGDPVTVEYKINFLRPAKGDRIVAQGSVLRAGRSVSVTRVDVYIESAGEQPKLCAALQQSVMRAPTNESGRNPEAG
jgi:uncharacterized protein (TIGR00369 family)